MTWSTGKAILTVKMNGDFLTVPIHFQRLRKWKGARNPVDFGFARTRMERGWIQMVKLSSGQYVIGFDNGYQFGKTVQSLFDNGVYAMGTVESRYWQWGSRSLIMARRRKLFWSIMGRSRR